MSGPSGPNARHLRRQGWIHITDLGGPSHTYPADWSLPALDDTKWWPPNYAMLIDEIITLRGGSVPDIDDLEKLFLMGDYAPDDEEWSKYIRLLYAPEGGEVQ